MMTEKEFEEMISRLFKHSFEARDDFKEELLQRCLEELDKDAEEMISDDISAEIVSISDEDLDKLSAAGDPNISNDAPTFKHYPV